MNFSFKKLGHRVLSIALMITLLVSVCVVGITPAAAADVSGELSHVGASGSGKLDINGATIKIDGDTIPSTSGTVSLYFTDANPLKIEASRRGRYFLKWEITGGTEDVDYELVDSNIRTSFMTINILVEGTFLNIKPTFTTDPGTSSVTFSAQNEGYVLDGSNAVESFTKDVTMGNTVGATAFSTNGDFIGWDLTGGDMGLDYEFISGSPSDETIEIKVLTQGAEIGFDARFNNDFFTVVFEDYDGTVLSTQTVAKGEAAIPPEAPVREGYIFTGWNKSYSSITSSTTITATYTELPQYTGTLLQPPPGRNG